MIVSTGELQEILDDPKPDDVRRATIHAMAQEIVERREEEGELVEEEPISVLQRLMTGDCFPDIDDE